MDPAERSIRVCSDDRSSNAGNPWRYLHLKFSLSMRIIDADLLNIVAGSAAFLMQISPILTGLICALAVHVDSASCNMQLLFFSVLRI